MSLLRHFGHGFESGHEIRHDLKRQQNRNEGSGAKCRMKIDGGAANGANAQENHEEKKYDPRRPILKGGAPADSPVVQHSKKHRKPTPSSKRGRKTGSPATRYNSNEFSDGKMYAASFPSATASHGQTMKYASSIIQPVK